MSTRSNIFVDFNGERKQFYHHCDGYVEGVGKDLVVYMEIAIARARNAIPYSLGLRTEKAHKEFLNILGKEGSYEPEEIGLHGDIEYLYYVKFVSGEKDTVSYTKINRQKREDKNYFQNLETAECGVHRICLSIKQD